MDAHLGYDKNSQEPKETENRRMVLERKLSMVLLEKQKNQYQETEIVPLSL